LKALGEQEHLPDSDHLDLFFARLVDLEISERDNRRLATRLCFTKLK
jgi:hypothetical protein